MPRSLHPRERLRLQFFHLRHGHQGRLVLLGRELQHVRIQFIRHVRSVAASLPHRQLQWCDQRVGVPQVQKQPGNWVPSRQLSNRNVRRRQQRLRVHSVQVYPVPSRHGADGYMRRNDRRIGVPRPCYNYYLDNNPAKRCVPQ